MTVVRKPKGEGDSFRLIVYLLSNVSHGETHFRLSDFGFWRGN